MPTKTKRPTKKERNLKAEMKTLWNLLFNSPEGLTVTELVEKTKWRRAYILHRLVIMKARGGAYQETRQVPPVWKASSPAVKLP